ncbi:MAG: Flp pilus assembly protein CpaB [Sphingomonas sp.]|jgi:pilus assembly protein CpaB|uniref:Flp pilus assembly protein CpaB n=1 Tax=unclassified Sphingomonas TaxID=196159 RepID=UPI00053EFB76|nr:MULTISPECIES: Flp pilus assembly protein CpaB [unclassified Sphingomonas]MDR6847494.1 pilus assembly protein CpaB [Sphingomonas sp. BE137]MDR7257037.1 pilus assembly protein CpaB [Sphingomonas sp. BE270]
MDSRKVILLLGALIVAAISAFMARSLIIGSPAPQANAVAMAPVANGPEVLVATKALPVGTILDATSLKYQPWPKELVENAYYIKKGGFDPRSLMGTVVRNAITAGQPITQGALVKPGDRGFLAAALGPGMRAVTVPVQTQTSVAGFVFPGDRIDLILTQTVPGGGDGPPLKAAETIMRNLRVLATDQRTDNGVGEDGKAVVRTFSNVTIEATPKIAEQIAVAQTLGSLSLSLRSIADNSSELEQAIASGDVSMPDDPKAEKAMLTRIASTPATGGGTMVTGADVSRFQRSTVPGKPADTSGSGGAPGTGTFPGAGTGPVIRVARGNAVTDVALGGKK